MPRTSRLRCRARGATASSCGSRARALWYARDLAGSRSSFLALAARSDIYPAWQAHALGTLSLIEAWSGDLGDAEEHGRHALRVAQANGLEGHPASVDASAGLAHVYRQRGDLVRAEALLDQAQAVLTAFRRPVAETIVVIERALCHLAAGHPDAGLAVVRADQDTEAAQRALRFFAGHYQGDVVTPAPRFHREAA